MPGVHVARSVRKSVRMLPTRPARSAVSRIRMRPAISLSARRCSVTSWYEPIRATGLPCSSFSTTPTP